MKRNVKPIEPYQRVGRCCGCDTDDIKLTLVAPSRYRCDRCILSTSRKESTMTKQDVPAFTTEEKLVAFALAFIIHAGRAIIGRDERDRMSAQSSIDFVADAKRLGIMPTKEDLR